MTIRQIIMPAASAAVLFVAIAFSARCAAGQAAMYVFAHEDDEINIAAKIASDIRSGKDVYCVWMTDGGKGGEPAEREKESREVMKLLGIPQDRLFFLGFPDQKSHMHLAEIIAALSAAAEKINPSEIITQAYEGGNIDHDTVSFVSMRVAKMRGIKLYDYPDTNVYMGATYIWRFLPGSPTPVLYTKLDKELYGLKFKILRMYPSQQSGLNAYEFFADKKQLKKLGEPYREAPDYDYSKPPAEELRYESTSKGTANIDMFLDAVGEYLKTTP